jgi:hypothetical protein
LKEIVVRKSNVVLIRTYSAGVHVGTPVGKLKGREITLKNAHRIWRWQGANTLHELSQSGSSNTSFTRISEQVPSITLTEVIEIIPCSIDAAKSLTTPVWLP